MDATVFNLITTTYFAAVKHKDQRRKDASETPYINHPIGNFIKVTLILISPTGRLNYPTPSNNVSFTNQEFLERNYFKL